MLKASLQAASDNVSGQKRPFPSGWVSLCLSALLLGRRLTRSNKLPSSRLAERQNSLQQWDFTNGALPQELLARASKVYSRGLRSDLFLGELCINDLLHLFEIRGAFDAAVVDKEGRGRVDSGFFTGSHVFFNLSFGFAVLHA